MSEQTPTLPSERLAALGLTLPTPAKPVASYIPAKRTGSLVFVSGQVPFVDGVLAATGSVPGRVSVEQAIECARICAFNAIAAAAAEAGGVDRIRSIVKVTVFVAAEVGFGDHPKVGNGASELFVEVFGEAGRHARDAVGCSGLPLDVPVEVDLVCEVE